MIGKSTTMCIRRWENELNGIHLEKRTGTSSVKSLSVLGWLHLVTVMSKNEEEVAKREHARDDHQIIATARLSRLAERLFEKSWQLPGECVGRKRHNLVDQAFEGCCRRHVPSLLRLPRPPTSCLTPTVQVFCILAQAGNFVDLFPV